MVFGNCAAKSPEVAKRLRVACVVAGREVLFATLVTPLIHLTNGTANWILRRLGIEPAEELRSARSPQELGSLVRNSARRGSLGPPTPTPVGRFLPVCPPDAHGNMTTPTQIINPPGDHTRAPPADEAG